MSEPVDVQGGDPLPMPGKESEEERVRKQRVFKPNDKQKAERLERTVEVLKAVVEPDKRPDLSLPGVDRTLREIGGLKNKASNPLRKFQKSPASPLTPTTPITPKEGGDLPDMDIGRLVSSSTSLALEQQGPVVDLGQSVPKEAQAIVASIAKQPDGPDPEFNRERAAKVLIEAFVTGDDAAAAKFNISKGRITTYRRYLEKDDALRRQVGLRVAELEQAWSVARMCCLRTLINRVEELALKSEDIYRLSGAIKILGELQVVVGVLNAGSTQASGQSSGAAEDSARATRGPVPDSRKLGR